MASGSSPIGISFSSSTTRKKKAYSVSLKNENLGISEVPFSASEQNVTVNDSVQGTAKTVCPYCGHNMLNYSNNSLNSVNAIKRNGNLDGTNVPSTQESSLPIVGYGSLTSSGEEYLTTSSSLDHCHELRQPQSDAQAKKKLIVASALCLIFMVGEVVGGYMANSLAIATDAAHLLTDFASFMISLFSLWISSRPATKKMSFGWYRAEVIGALTSVLMIWVVTGVLVYMAIQRLIDRDITIDAKVMLITSGIGVVFNIIMGCTLHQHGHSHSGAGHHHSHGHHSHDSESQSLLSQNHFDSNEDGNINVRAAFVHVVGDFVQSLGVFIAALIIFYKPDWVVIDPVCTFLFSGLVLLTTIAILKDALTVLMEGLPRGLDFNQVQETFLSIDGVLRVHNLRIWALSMDKTALAAHLAIRPGAKTQQILLQASRLVRSRFNLFEMTLQIEEFETGMEDCSQCRSPEC